MPYNQEFKEFKNYYELGLVVHKIQEKLKQETGLTFQLYSDEATSNEIWEILGEDLEQKKESVQLITHLFDCIETNIISSTHTDKEQEFIIKPRIPNSVFYYPEYKVALFQVILYHNHGELHHAYVLGYDDDCMTKFLQYVLKRRREYIRNHITVFTDTQHGVESTKEKITTLVTREDVFLEESIKKQIYRSIDEFFLKSGEFFHKYNIPYKRGILLYGKPGNGKTTLVKSIANSITSPVAYWQITEYTSSYSIQEVFGTIAKMTPMVLVIEDIDSMPEDVRSVFLNMLDGATSKEGIFLIGTTNYPEKIDPALINRAGRFDRAYEIKIPTEEMRYKYLLKKKIDDIISTSELADLAARTEEFSYAQLNEIYNAIALQWHYDGEVDLEQLCNELHLDNKKSKKQSWNSNGDTSPVGFNF
ncbi:AAA family ATPase [Bacillus tamaricis]|uniref:AAA family ATPase n=1 Tax=Evansella tamaricis TaxID=2069301 RepID=A0ABS6JAE5_9BACI|nr:AAA family ATPase [Evansella tamaricis]